MDWLDTTVTLVVGTVIRLGIPIVITVFLVMWLRRLDESWSKEAEVNLAATVEIAKNIGCWEINECAIENRETCLAYAQPDTPCWQVYRSDDGQLNEKCLACQVFRSAPAVVTTDWNMEVINDAMD